MPSPSCAVASDERGVDFKIVVHRSKRPKFQSNPSDPWVSERLFREEKKHFGGASMPRNCEGVARKELYPPSQVAKKMKCHCLYYPVSVDSEKDLYECLGTFVQVATTAVNRHDKNANVESTVKFDGLGMCG
jgi:hypothetical protein